MRPQKTLLNHKPRIQQKANGEVEQRHFSPETALSEDTLTEQPSHEDEERHMKHIDEIENTKTRQTLASQPSTWFEQMPDNHQNDQHAFQIVEICQTLLSHRIPLHSVYPMQ